LLFQIPGQGLAEVLGTLLQPRKPLCFSGHVLGEQGPPQWLPSLILQIFIGVFPLFHVPLKVLASSNLLRFTSEETRSRKTSSEMCTGSILTGSFCESTNFPCLGPNQKSLKLFHLCNLTILTFHSI